MGSSRGRPGKSGAAKMAIAVGELKEQPSPPARAGAQTPEELGWQK
jgi:hypothetical protein